MKVCFMVCLDIQSAVCFAREFEAHTCPRRASPWY